jgi:O-antigen/teichoic acid export membrane protein
MLLRLFNASLRLGSLALKLALTLYMGRYLPLEDLGTYGLVAAYVSIIMTLIGLRFDYIILRDIVSADILQETRLLRDQFIFYSLNYLVLLLAASIFYVTPLNTLSLGLFTMVIALSVMESLGAITNGALTSMRRPITANFMFFMRAAAWVVPVILLGLISPNLRTAEFIFLCWIIGAIISLLLTGWIWRNRPWAELWHEPVRWAYMRSALKVTLPIWLGTVGTIFGTLGDRFITEHFLGRESVGIISFYGSFIIAVSSVLTSGIFAFAYPQLVELHRAGNTRGFVSEARKMSWQATLSATLMVITIGALVPWLGDLLGKPELASNSATLWLMLLAVWLRSVSEGLYYMLYARELDRPIWIGNVLFATVTLVAGLILTPAYGLPGVGYASVIAAVFISLWRLYHVRQTP